MARTVTGEEPGARHVLCKAYFCVNSNFKANKILSVMFIRIVSVNYLFGRPLIPYNFLKGIFTLDFRDMGNLRPSVFGLKKMFRVPKKGQLRFSERE